MQGYGRPVMAQAHLLLYIPGRQNHLQRNEQPVLHSSYPVSQDLPADLQTAAPICLRDKWSGRLQPKPSSQVRRGEAVMSTVLNLLRKGLHTKGRSPISSYPVLGTGVTAGCHQSPVPSLATLPEPCTWVSVSKLSLSAHSALQFF